MPHAVELRNKTVYYSDMVVPEFIKDLFLRAVFYTKWLFEFFRVYGVFFLPSITLLIGGCAIYFNPKAFIYVLSIFLVTLGFAGMVCTWKLLILKEKLQDFTQKFDGRIMVHGVKLQDIEDLVDDLPFDPEDQNIH